jgi:hypothetical protein
VSGKSAKVAARSHVDVSRGRGDTRISKTRRRNIEEYIEYLQIEMRLTEWLVVLQEEATDNPEHAAEIGTSSVNRVVALSVSDKFLNHPDYNDELRKQSLIHELMHLHLEGAWQFASKLFRAELSFVSAGQAQNTFDTFTEQAIDQISFALVDLIRKPFKLDG